jgi:site-specific DNA-adenine methylase
LRDAGKAKTFNKTGGRNEPEKMNRHKKLKNLYAFLWRLAFTCQDWSDHLRYLCRKLVILLN